MSILLRAENLSMMRTHRIIFRHLSLSLYRGEALHLFGENGSGKTTLLQILANTLQASHGNIQRHEALLFLGHKAGVKPLLTARENLRFAAKLYHGMKNEVDSAVETALAQVGLSALADRQIRYLSAGQQRRVQLARLWLDTPPIWLLDEPLTALDVDSVAHLHQRCIQHLQQGGGLLFTSHQPFLSGIAHAVQLTEIQKKS